MRLRVLLFTLLAIAFSPPAFAQSLAKTFTLSAANQCAQIGTSGLPTIGIDLTGTSSLTLQPKVSINGSVPKIASVTSTVAGSQPQATIVTSGSTNASYAAPVGGFDTFSLCVSSYSSGTATVLLNPSPALYAGFLGSGGSDSGVSSFFGNTGDITALVDPTDIVDGSGNAVSFTSNGLQLPQPTVFGAGTYSSLANECASITLDSIGDTITTQAIARVVGASNVAHDIICEVTADASFPGTIGSLVFPLNTAISTCCATANGPTNQFDINSAASGGALLVMSNLGGSNRENAIHFRACNGPGTQGCGTDFALSEDPTGAGHEEYLFTLIGGNSPLYMGNVLNSTHPGIYLGGADASGTASPGASFGLARVGAVSNTSDHLVRLSAHNDIWQTATLSSGTVSVSFQTAFNLTPICMATWQGAGTLTGILKCTPSTTGLTIASSVNTDTAVVGYLVLGNNN